MLKSKLNIAAFVFLAMGLTSALCEKIFYGGRLDENNIVQESFFLPLSFLCFFIALVLWTVLIAIKSLPLLKKR